MMGGTHMTQRERKGIAVSRFEIIAPLMQAGTSDAEKCRIRVEIMEKNKISERTLRRYAAAYRKDGFDGLVPSSRPDAGAFKAIPPDIISKAVELKTGIVNNGSIGKRKENVSGLEIVSQSK